MKENPVGRSGLLWAAFARSSLRPKLKLDASPPQTIISWKLSLIVSVMASWAVTSPLAQASRG